MDYQIECKTCRQTLRIRENVIGRKLRCPSCKAEVIAEPQKRQEKPIAAQQTNAESNSFRTAKTNGQMALPAIIGAVFNPKMIEDYLAINNDESLSSFKKPFPFSPSEFTVLRWHLQFANVACAHHLLEEGKEKLMQELTAFIRQQENEVRVGDYVNAKREISKIRGFLGPRGWLFPITDRKVPLRIISAGLVNVKLQVMLELFSIAEKSSLILDWSDYKEMADEYAFYTLMSYWGREPDDQRDGDSLEGLSELIYTNLIGLRDMIQPNKSTDMVGFD